MSDWLKRNGAESDSLGRDPQLAEILSSLDPAIDDPNYWLRFRGWVVAGAARELARRRLMAQVTVGDVMSSWARTLVPTAMLAAALAGMLLMRGPRVPEPRALALEEQLVREIPGETVPVLLTADGSEGVVAFAADTF